MGENRRGSFNVCIKNNFFFYIIYSIVNLIFIQKSKFHEALDKLSKLSIMTTDSSGYIQINSSFRERFQDCLTGG